MTYDAILPAGGRLKPEFAAKVGTDAKALIEFGGQTILERTIAALRETGMIHRIVLVGGEAVQARGKSLVDVVLPEGTSGPDNIHIGLMHLLSSPNPPDKVVIVTTDLPYLTGKMISSFLGKCPSDADICVPIVRESDYKSRFPNTTSTYVPLADDRWTMGCAYLIDVKALQRAMPRLEQVFAARKSVLRMAMLLGPRFLLLFALKKLTVPDIEKKISAMLGCVGKPVFGAPPELAYDVDDLDDYTYAMGQAK